ncbi:hypothetical protein J2790_002197 [Paenarthrobacter nicotinovorans]|uniref:hypothetical protein n=1 Tax=Micrococcaceae TaxID=1268 RepID=UPI0008773B78|nr:MULTISPECIES: hypothetical protein [Micrococcaceae]MDR6437054.1 hypothetical protein [Paenarthrobacter nicotinovorans]SCZ54700.1 hypothetical protein SAMN02799638_01562 [Arthrobacter sp. UNCCL28]
MASTEYRAGETTYGPLQLKSIWINHGLRDFELVVIIQASGCELIAERLIQGESVSGTDEPPLEVANYIAKQKGYLPLFDLSGQEPDLAGGAEAGLRDFFSSDEWNSRDPRKTRRI